MHDSARPLILLLVVFTFTGPARATAEIQAGLAQADITPPIGGGTTGYAGSPPTDGVHDKLSARVLLLKSKHSKLVLVSCDLCIFNSAWLHQQVQSLGYDRLLLMNTHTHAGPNLRQDDFPSPDEPWRKTVEERILAAIRQAEQSLFPAHFLADEGRIHLGYNRLVRQGEHAVTHFENPDRIPYGSVDSTVGVIRVTDDDANVQAVLVVYACHPVVLGPKNAKLSADYPGVMREIVETELGGEPMCIFIQGAGGDINPLMMARGDDREHDFELVGRVGRLLAEEVLRTLRRMKGRTGISDSLVSASAEMEFSHRFSPEEKLTMGVTTLLINREIGVITMPGEPFHQYQLDWRQASGLAHAYLFGYCCNGPYDWPAYLPDIHSAARGGYGASDTTRAEVGGGERLWTKGLAQLFTLQGRLKSQPQRHVFDD